MNVKKLSLLLIVAGSLLFYPIRSYSADRIKVALTTVGGSFFSRWSRGKERIFSARRLER
jgi:hypothetical protein